MKDYNRILNLELGKNPEKDKAFFEYVNMRLFAAGLPVFGKEEDYPVVNLAKPLLKNFQEIASHAITEMCPVDQRIVKFLKSYLDDVLDKGEDCPTIPQKSFIMERPGVARILSMPPDKDEYHNDYVSSYRVRQGILHNPKNDKRTTKGIFHIAEGGLPIPDDKKALPKVAFKNLLKAALNPPENLLEFPFTSTQQKKAKMWASLLLRPTVCPEVPDVSPAKSMEIRFFAPGAMVCNLDFVESIFGNYGNPYLVKNDAALDENGWTGHTGCIILAPHLTKFTKKELGLPHISKATERQKRDGMCYESDDELYNSGKAFKATARDENGVIVTLIADNYFGYSKKEVKTFISYSANLFGQAEEEHSGGTIAFSSRDLGDDFYLRSYAENQKFTFADTVNLLGDSIEVHPDGYAIDKKYPNIIYIDSDCYFSLRTQTATWQKDGQTKSLKLAPNITYISPAGYKIEMQRPHESRRWRLVGTVEKGVLCHKPATVSGGGKSEISKNISDAIIHGPAIVADFKNDIKRVEKIINKDYGHRFKDDTQNKHELSRKFLDERRTMGSVVKLLSESDDYTDEYNEWVRNIPFYIREFALTVKRHYRLDWNGDWQSKFSVDRINGKDGNILKYKNSTVLTSYMRVGFTADGSWRTFSLRKDYAPSVKLQVEDDITASTVVSTAKLDSLSKEFKDEPKSVKFVENCEHRFFQRPDDAVIRGYDKKAESDMSQKGSFFSNYEPLTRADVQTQADDVLRFCTYTPPMKENLEAFLSEDKPDYVVSSANPRLVNGTPSANVRYLQNTDEITNPRKYYIGEMGARLHRHIPLNKSVPMPVNAVISGRRNNPASDGIKPLALHGPLHYLELPELFMEYIASMTGKSPSTTGAGLEGAMTKLPFNALCPISDLNAALVSFALTKLDGWLSSTGYLGPKYKINHDISLLIPELWCKMSSKERNVNYLIENKLLERCKDFEYKGKKILASRLGWRINQDFVMRFFGRIFSSPSSIFTEDMLRPELQDMDIFADGMDNMVSAHQRAAQAYFNDGSIEGACPPIKALLYIMKDGSYEGKTLDSPEIRDMFKTSNILNSEWYAERLIAKQQVDIHLCVRVIEALKNAKNNAILSEYDTKLDEKMEHVQARLKGMKGIQYLKSLAGTLGADPFLF